MFLRVPEAFRVPPKVREAKVRSRGHSGPSTCLGTSRLLSFSCQGSKLIPLEEDSCSSLEQETAPKFGDYLFKCWWLSFIQHLLHTKPFADAIPNHQEQNCRGDIIIHVVLEGETEVQSGPVFDSRSPWPLCHSRDCR